MTLAEIASYVTSKVNQTQTEDVAACKQFIRRRYEMIWNDQLWKDSLAQINTTLDPTNSDNAAGILVLPELIDRPVAIRSADRAVLVNPLERYYRIDLDMFARSGTQYECALLNPAWLTVRPIVPAYTAITVSGLSVGTGPWGILVTGLTVGAEYRIIGGATELGYEKDNVLVVIPLTPGVPSYFTSGAANIIILSTAGSQPFSGTLDLVSVRGSRQDLGAGSTIVISSSDAGDTASPIKIVWRDQTGKRYEQTGGLPQTLTPDDDAGYFEIESIYKSTTVGTISVTLHDADGATEVVGTIVPSATRTPSYQRVRLFDTPNQSATLKVAGKVKCDSLDFDNQEPTLRGCENILIAFAQGDMLERERRYGQAQAMFAEATMLLEQLKRIEVVQQAHNVRIIPQFGFISDYDLYASNLLSF